VSTPQLRLERKQGLHPTSQMLFDTCGSGKSPPFQGGRQPGIAPRHIGNHRYSYCDFPMFAVQIIQNKHFVYHNGSSVPFQLPIDLTRGKYLMLGKANRNFGQKSWPRIHLFYFLIAALNLAAILGGLYLNRLLIDVHRRSVEQTAVFDRQMADSWAISDAAAKAQEEYIRVLDTKALDHAIPMFNSKSFEFGQAVNRLRMQIPNNFEEKPAKRALSILLQMDSAMATMKKQADEIASLLITGDEAATRAALIKMVDRYSSLRFNAIDLNQLIGRVKLKALNDVDKTLSSLRTFEFYISGVLALIICGLAYYGFFMGRLLKRKFSELAKAHAELEESHQQALAFSREIQTVNGDMGTLNRQLKDNLAKLREAQDDALRKGKMAQLGNLTATVAHELRNPLSTVRTSTYLLARKIKDKGLGIEPQLQRINNGVIRCDNIITQLLDFSRSKAVKAELTVLDAWLEKLVQSEAQRLPEIVSIICNFGLGEQLVELEPGRFERAIINLMSNASEALVGKGDDPKARFTETPTINISTQITSRGAEISVTDNGPGISAENLSKIREPLFTTKNFGTGLGLPAVEQILEQHGGGMEIRSSQGQGATFTIWLPIGEKSGEQAA
jgi:signal transduction histidine kinase